jgi:hypothetical protein
MLTGLQKGRCGLLPSSVLTPYRRHDGDRQATTPRRDLKMGRGGCGRGPAAALALGVDRVSLGHTFHGITQITSGSGHESRAH